MDLKDIVLSTLCDMEIQEEIKKNKDTKKPASSIKTKDKSVKTKIAPLKEEPTKSDEEQFLKNLKDRVLVMFEGYSSLQNKNVEAKLDITINFLEHLLSVTQERLDIINASKK